jgi:hypothetical protein
MTIDMAWVPRRSPHLHTAVLDDEAVLYDERTHSTLRLNTSGTAIWLAIDGRTSAGSIVADLAARHGASPVDVARDVGDVLARLVADGAVLAAD